MDHKRHGCGFCWPYKAWVWHIYKAWVWLAHCIVLCRYFMSTWCYLVILGDIQCNFRVLDDTCWYLMVLHGTWWNIMLHNATWKYLMILDGTWFNIVLHNATWILDDTPHVSFLSPLYEGEPHLWGWKCRSKKSEAWYYGKNTCGTTASWISCRYVLI